tara:strand:+ start:86 stop:355 length:270 start_codon:yes stop_codon:yes gene_type:complete
MKGDINDPKALIREAYNIDGISLEECRTIFLDWAISLSLDHDTKKVLKNLLEQYGTKYPSHPMTKTIREGLKETAKPRRRGKRRTRNWQ